MQHGTRHFCFRPSRLRYRPVFANIKSRLGPASNASLLTTKATCRPNVKMDDWLSILQHFPSLHSQVNKHDDFKHEEEWAK